jgi:hypothetical protein
VAIYWKGNCRRKGWCDFADIACDSGGGVNGYYESGKISPDISKRHIAYYISQAISLQIFPKTLGLM